jgi:hypothetical protein
MTVLILNGRDRLNSKKYSHCNNTWLSEFSDRFSNYEEKEMPMKIPLTIEKLHTN